MPRGREPKAANDLARYRGLVAAGAISPRNSTRSAAWQRRRADLKRGPGAGQCGAKRHRLCRTLADADGVVVETLAEPGQVVSAGQVVIRLARAGQREARVQLPETLRPAVGSEALATRYGGESQPVTATLRLLSDAADATTRT